jgi:hypothetical protein
MTIVPQALHGCLEQLFGSGKPPSPPAATNTGFVTNFADAISYDQRSRRSVQDGTTASAIMGMFRPRRCRYCAVSQHPGDLRVELAEVHLGLRARQMRLRHRDLALVQAQLGAAAGHIPRHRHLGQRGTVLGDQPLPDPPGRMPLLARHLPARHQPPIDDRRIRADRRPGRGEYSFRGGGTALTSAWRTVRRCT